MSKPDLTKIEKLLKSGEDFSLNDAQYKSKTGLSIPKNPYYLIKNSAIAKLARRYGFRISHQERKISFEKDK